MAKFTLGQPGVNPFAKKLKPVSSPPSNANDQSPMQMDAVKRRLENSNKKKKKHDKGDAADIKQGIVDSAAEDAADAKAGKP